MDEIVCEACGEPIAEGEEVLKIENPETKETHIFHLTCVDKVGTA